MASVSIRRHEVREPAMLLRGHEYMEWDRESNCVGDCCAYPDQAQTGGDDP
ncbi:hypothetical protein PTKU46_79400 [Paraburkholderia terrae]